MTEAIKPNSVLLGDCVKLLPKVRASSVDLIAIDPPYEIGYNGCDWDQKGGLSWNILEQEFTRVLKPDGNLIIFQGWTNVSQTITSLSNSFHLKNWIIYDRIKGRGARTNLVSTREDILWFVKDTDNYTYNKIPSTIKKKTGGTIGKKNGNAYRAMSNVWTDIAPIVPWSKERAKHPTQKPLQIMDRILRIFSNKNDIVLDCFAGSGSTIISAIKTERQYIGFEKDDSYFGIIQGRITSENEK